jgi:glucose dehydrogenase
MASVNSQPLALAAKPLTQLEANWAASNGDGFNTDYNPQNQINSSNAQYLGLSWLFPLPTHPTALLSVSAGLGVDTAPMIVNGTIYAVTQFDQAFALNAANGNVLWTDVLPLNPNSTQGKGVGTVSLHLHDGNQQFTTKLFGNTPTWWISADDYRVYALNALNGKYELNFSIFDGLKTVDGLSPTSQYHGLGASNLLLDQNKGLVITSVISTNNADTGRCFFRGWNVNVSPPSLLWTSYCTPPQPGGNVPVDPMYTINQVNSMKGAQIFYPGPAYNAGGPIPGSAVVDLKKLSTTQLNSTLYDDWGYSSQTAECKASTGGMSTGSTAAGWGAPWILGVGPTTGLAFVNTNNKDPYAGPCTPGPDLWSAAILALNETNGNIVWGFQANAHDLWDYDCSWWQAMGNQTVNGANTQVIWKTCKAGYLFELNAQTGALIWAWTPPTSIENRCQFCYMLNPLNKTEMSRAYFNPNGMGAGQLSICTPCTFSFESEGAFNPATNYIYVVSQNYPQQWAYIPPNATNYHTSGGTRSFPLPGQTATTVTTGIDNSTAEAINAATGQMVWSHFIPTQGYRGGVATSGNILYLTLSSGSLLMLNAKTGDVLKDYFIGGPLNVHPSIGATSSGQIQVILPITAGLVSWGTGVPGDIVALTLQNVPSTQSTNTITTTSTISAVPQTTTQTTTVTSGGGGGVSTTTLYGVAAVAAIFIIATGYLAMRGRKPAA